MADIDFNFSAAYECASSLRKTAAQIEQEIRNMDSIIAKVREGWQGAGAEQYITYLETLRRNISERAQRLYDISDAVNTSAAAAEEADRKASKLAGNNDQACPPPTAANTPAASPPKSADTLVCPPKNAADVAAKSLDMLKDIASLTRKRSKR